MGGEFGGKRAIQDNNSRDFILRQEPAKLFLCNHGVRSSEATNKLLCVISSGARNLSYDPEKEISARGVYPPKEGSSK